MGGKLSDIQRDILIFCLKERFLTSQDILRQVFGGREYNVAHATMSRTLTRLWGRNLITIWKTLSQNRTGVSLTPEGEMLARTTLAETGKSRIRG